MAFALWSDIVMALLKPDCLGAVQVRFLYETFRRMRPGVPLMALYGKQKQMKRMAIYNDFCKV
jgi:hypothetical protein